MRLSGFFTAFFSVMLLSAAPVAVHVPPDAAVIVVPEQADGTVKFAAQELQKHLRLISGALVPVVKAPVEGKYLFRFDVPKSAKEIFPQEWARWTTTPRQSVFQGDDTPTGAKINLNKVLNRRNKNGTMSAVYDFLEKQFGVLWLEPGDAGIVHPEQKTLELKSGSGFWEPGALVQREIRRDYGSFASYAKESANLPKEFRLDSSAQRKNSEETGLWLKRQRMGRSLQMEYGHAFTRWWQLYGKEHPEYFALQPDGKRGMAPRLAPDRVKLCVSNPAVIDQIVENWKKSGMRQTINVCENDSAGYCTCAECRKLDVPKADEARDANLSDRYIHFANEVQRKAAKFRPDVAAIHYAYSCYKFPPRREKVDPAVIIGFVPSMMFPDQVAEHYKAWRAAGAERLFLRPNDQHINTGLPMGIEKQLFDHFQLGYKNGIIGSDYDSLHGFWPATGVADYILARAHVHPNRSFEKHMDEYCSAYGPAAPEARDYFAYWRTQVWEKRLLPNRAKIQERGRYGNFRRGLMWDLGDYYKRSDFDATDAILRKGAERKDLSARQRGRLETLMLANAHARTTYEAMSAKGKEKAERALELLKFRIANRDRLNFNWGQLIGIELGFGDTTGIGTAARFIEFSDRVQLPLKWQFAIDPQNIGEQEKWYQLPWARIQKSWRPISVNSSWEQQTLKELDPQLRETLKTYDGIGWYAQKIRLNPEWKGKNIELFFGAVDESAWVYVNGKFCGKRIFSKDDDWKTPFTIPITDAIDWTQPIQTAVVRVEDKNGLGGIWRPVFLVTR